MLVATNPNWAESLTGIGTIVIAGGIIFAGFGARAAGKQIRQAESSRTSDLLMNMANRFDHSEMAESRQLTKVYQGRPEEFCNYYVIVKNANSPEYFKLLRLANFFEYWGILEANESLGIELIEQSIGTSARFYWEIWRQAIESTTDWDGLYENWTALVKKLEARQQAQLAES